VQSFEVEDPVFLDYKPEEATEFDKFLPPRIEMFFVEKDSKALMYYTFD
jgi:hypothetical protein